MRACAPLRRHHSGHSSIMMCAACCVCCGCAVLCCAVRPNTHCALPPRGTQVSSGPLCAGLLQGARPTTQVQAGTYRSCTVGAPAALSRLVLLQRSAATRLDPDGALLARSQRSAPSLSCLAPRPATTPPPSCENSACRRVRARGRCAPPHTLLRNSRIQRW